MKSPRTENRIGPSAPPTRPPRASRRPPSAPGSGRTELRIAPARRSSERSTRPASGLRSRPTKQGSSGSDLCRGSRVEGANGRLEGGYGRKHLLRRDRIRRASLDRVGKGFELGAQGVGGLPAQPLGPLPPPPHTNPPFPHPPR